MPQRVKEINRKSLGIRTGDDVIVLSGAGKSKTPRKVLKVLTAENQVVVEGVNMVKERPKNKGGQRASGINEQPIAVAAPIHRSKVALVDPKTKKPTRIHMTEQNGKRVRTAKSGETI